MTKKFLKKCCFVLTKVYVPIGLSLSILGVISHSAMKATLFSAIKNDYPAVIEYNSPASVANADVNVETHATFSLIPQRSRFITIDEELSVIVSINAGLVINAVEATISFPYEDLELVAISEKNSIIIEWIQEPTFLSEVGIIKFAGVIHGGGFSGSGEVMTLTFRPKKLGTSRITFTDGSILAHGTLGTDVLKDKIDMTYFVRRTHFPSPDLNFDDVIDSLDIEILNDHWGELRSAQYDLNQDGIVSLPDFNILSSLYEE